MVRFNRVTIVGLGLIGGSLGMAIKRKQLANEVVGYSRKPSTLAQAKRRGAIDRGSTSLEEAVHDTELIVLAVPVDAMVPLALRLRHALKPGAILTDVGSSKAQLVRRLETVMPKGTAFVGAHPLAGSEQRGIAAACPELFDGSCCIITRTRRTDPKALRRVARFWTPVVQRVEVMDPARHDALLAAVSHVPHLLAFSLMLATPSAARAIAPRSFLEVTRVASSDPGLWQGIVLSNRREILAALDRLDRVLRQGRAAIARADSRRLHQWLVHAHRLRQALPNSSH